MEAQQQQQQNNNQQQQQQNEDGGSGKAANFLCRQSSTRWTPTTDQIRILKDLYYNNGVRSPNAEQIQRISARLRQYGKIEGKNVFYWFQNHKARERQKKRFTAEIPVQRSPSWRSHHDHHQDPIYTKYPHNLGQAGVPSPSSSSSSPGVLAVGQMGNYGYGPVTMEKSFRDCSISAGGSVGHSFWVGADHPYASSYNHFFDKRNSTAGEIFPEEEQELEQEEAQEIETLPLFPMHGEDMPAGFCSIKSETETFSGAGCYNSDYAKGSSRTSLELSLNSYIGRFSDST